jgi:hypothetical protein
MFNTAWTDLVLKVGGQILLAVLVILTVTFGADPFFPKENAANMIASRSTQALPTPTVTTATTVTANTNAKVKVNANAKPNANANAKPNANANANAKAVNSS